jgi:hypothetical protein
MDTPSKVSLDSDSYRTPSCTQPFSLTPSRFYFTRNFLTRRKRYRRGVGPSHLDATMQPDEGLDVPRSQKGTMMALAEWLRWAAVSLGVGKHVFDNALEVLTESSQKMENTYALAAACLLIATKLENSALLARHRELPVRPANRLPRVRISDASKVEGLLLNVLLPLSRLSSSQSPSSPSNSSCFSSSPNIGTSFSGGTSAS